MNTARHPTADVVVLDNPWLETRRPTLPPPKPLAVSRPSIFDSRICSSTVAATIAVAIHAIAIGPLVFGIGGHWMRPPPAEGIAANSLAGKASEAVSTYIVVNDTSIAAENDPDRSAYAIALELESTLRQAPLSASVDLPLVPTLGDIQPSPEPSALAADATGDAGQAAMLFGRYMGQIKARIEQAWQSPASAAKQAFHCTAEIRQMPSGVVQEVTLKGCDMDPQWQVSLVQAIQFASPLSAPPSEKLFTDVVTLNFERHKAR